MEKYAPQTWFEKMGMTWDPDTHELVPQQYGVTVTPAAGQAGAQGQIQVPEPIYTFGLLSSSFVTATGVAPTILYRIGFKTSREDWTNGQWSSRIVTGDIGAQAYRPPIRWENPRFLAQNEIVIVTVDNNYTASVGVTVDASVWGYCLRQKPSGRR